MLPQSHIMLRYYNTTSVLHYAPPESHYDPILHHYQCFTLCSPRVTLCSDITTLPVFYIMLPQSHIMIRYYITTGVLHNAPPESHYDPYYITTSVLHNAPPESHYDPILHFKYISPSRFQRISHGGHAVTPYKTILFCAEHFKYLIIYLYST